MNLSGTTVYVAPWAPRDVLLGPLISEFEGPLHVAFDSRRGLESSTRVGDDTTPTVSSLGLGRGLARDVAVMQRFLSRYTPDAIVVHGSYLCVVAAAALRSMRSRPRMIAVRHHNRNHHLQRSRKAVAADKFVSRTADAVIAPSLAVAETLSVEGCPETKIHHIPHGVSLRTLREAEGERLGSADGQEDRTTLRLLAMGRLDWQKDYVTMFKALASARARGLNFSLQILGDGSAESRRHLSRLSSDIGIEDVLSFCGWVPNPYDYLRRADILVHTARDEAFGLALVEAMLARIPVVSTGPGGAREVLSPWYSWVDAGDDRGVSEHLLGTAHRLETARAHAVEIADLVEAQFDVSKMTAAHYRVYRGD